MATGVVMPNQSMCDEGRYQRCVPIATPEWLGRREEAAASLQATESGTFVIVGAHHFGGKGEANDPDFFVRLAGRFTWGGVLLVEASPHIAKDLGARMKHSSLPFALTPSSRIKVSNVGICPTSNGTERGLPFYTVSARSATGDTRLPDWSDQFGSFNRTHVMRLLPAVVRAIPGPHNWTVAALAATVSEHRVPCVSLESELQRRRLPPPSIILIDTEGLDCAIVADLDLCRTRPSLLQYEHGNCPRHMQMAALSNIVGATGAECRRHSGAAHATAVSSMRASYAVPARIQADTGDTLTFLYPNPHIQRAKTR